ncbi:MAG: hypothetical protein IJF54_06470 [Clostridia bacterium]|nr:hypothetical protein [Clostridia bacterium]
MKKILVSLCCFVIILSMLAAITVTADTKKYVYGDYLVSVNTSTSARQISVNTPGLSYVKDAEVTSVVSVGGEELGVQRFNLESVLKNIKKPENSQVLANRVSVEGLEPNLYVVGSTKTFTLLNMKGGAGTEYQKTLQMIYSGSHCTIWNDPTFPITDAAAEHLALEYDRVIFPILSEYFGDMMDADADGKLAICFYDILDDFSQSNPVGVSGYFNAADMVSTYYGGNGNMMDMIHIDCNEFMRNNDYSVAKETLIHEGQHCVNFSETWNNPNKSGFAETWLNESMSQAATILYDQSTIDYHVRCYNDHPKADNSLYNWNNSLYNYALGAFYSDYLRLQTANLQGGGNKIFKSIVNSNYIDENAVAEALEGIGYQYTYADFYANFRIALLANYPTGVHGFLGDTSYDKIKIHELSTTENTSLKAGEVMVTPICVKQAVSYMSGVVQVGITTNKYPVTSNTYTMKNNLVLGISPKTQVANVTSRLSSSYSLSTPSTAATVYSGMPIYVKDGTKTVKLLYAVVKGDVDGNGNVTASDLLKVKRMVLAVDQTEFYQESAGDVNVDGSVTASDLLEIKRYILSLKAL